MHVVGVKHNGMPLRIKYIPYFYPMQFYIETERLIMRDLLATDDVAMFAMDSDAEVHKYVGGKPNVAIEQTRENIAAIREQYISNGIGRWAVIEKSSGDFIGWAGLKLMTWTINGHINYYDLGYRFMKKHWGKGYATEAALAAVAYGWDVLKAPAMYGMANVDNMASRNVLEKCGMQFVNTFDYEDIIHAWYRLDPKF